MSNVWGPIVDGADVEAALLAHLRHWMPAAIAYVRRQKDPDKKLWPEGVEAIREYGVSHADAAAMKWPEDQLPMLIAQSPGMEDDPVMEGDGNVSGTYGVMLSAISSGYSMADAKALARVYASAARLAIVQNPQLDAGSGTPFASHVAMGPERNGQVRRGVEAERHLMVCSVPYLIEVPTIMRHDGGPLSVPVDIEEEPPEWPNVKPGGGSVKVDALTEGDFFDQKS